MLQLRALEPADVELLYSLENEEAVWSYGSTTAPYSRYALEQYVLTSLNDFYQDRQLRLVIDCDGVAVGLVDLYDYSAPHARAEVGIALLPQHRGAGIGTSALQLLISYVRKHLRLHQLFATVATTNPAAYHAFCRAGFVPTSLLRDWVALTPSTFSDAHLLQLVLD